MTTIKTWRWKTISDERVISIHEGDDLLNARRFYFRTSNECDRQIVDFLEELRNYFAFKLELE